MLEIVHVQHAVYDAGVAVEAKVFGGHSDLQKLKVWERTKGSANEPASLCLNVVQVEVQGKELQLWYGFEKEGDWLYSLSFDVIEVGIKGEGLEVGEFSETSRYVPSSILFDFVPMQDQLDPSKLLPLYL